MSLPLTPARLAGIYEMLRTCPPFCRWSMPPASEVKFCVMRSRFKHGDYGADPKDTFRVSEGTNSHLFSFVIVMAHEIVHQRLRRSGYKNWDAHGPAFERLARAVCRRHGWDLKQFM